MKKYLLSQNKGFTLVELLVGITIVTTLIGGVMIYIDNILNNYTDTHFKSTSLNELEIFKERLAYDSKVFDESVFLGGEILPVDRGFSLLLKTNSLKDKGVLIGVFDTIDEKVIYGSISEYSIYKPFLYYLDNEVQVNSLINDKDTFLESIDIEKLYIYDISMIKLYIKDINEYQKQKIDFVFTPKKYSHYVNHDILDVLQKLKPTKLSIIN